MSESNVITIAGKEYEESTMDAQQMYLINQIRDLQARAGSLRFQLDQVQVAQDAFTTALIQSVEGEEELDEAAVEKPPHTPMRAAGSTVTRFGFGLVRLKR
jgi:hypothetical protein